MLPVKNTPTAPIKPLYEIIFNIEIGSYKFTVTISFWFRVEGPTFNITNASNLNSGTNNSISYDDKIYIYIYIYNQRYTFIFLNLERPDYQYKFFVNYRLEFSIDLSIGPETLLIQNSSDINIASQLLIDASDLGHTIFEISNYNNQYIKRFERDCVIIVSVLKGIGSTTHDKINYLYENEVISVPGPKFINNLIKYALVKYFLAKLLYGKWNVKYLLNKYHNKFINDLRNSKLQQYVEFITTPKNGIYYNKFFYYHAININNNFDYSKKI